MAAGPEAAACRLYLDLPASPDGAPAALLDGILKAGDIACVLLPGPVPTDLLARLQAADAAVLLAGDALFPGSGADGVHLADATLYAAARRRVGPQAIVGVAGEGDRDAVWAAAEEGADYVAFGSDAEGADPDFIGWWARTMVVPVVAQAGGDLGAAPGLVRAGADFLRLGAALWRQDDPVAAVARIQAAIGAV